MIYEIYGPPGSGKSTYVLNKLKDKEHICLYVNADRQLMDNIITDDTFIVNSNDVLTIKKIITELSESVDSVVIDSLPMIIDEENNPSKTISEVQKIISICNRNKIDLYIINQYRQNDKVEGYTYYLNRLRIYYNERIKVGE